MRPTAADVRTTRTGNARIMPWIHGMTDHSGCPHRHIPYPVIYKHDEHILPAVHPESKPPCMWEELTRTSSRTSRSHRASSWQLRTPHDDGVWWRTGRWQGGTVFSRLVALPHKIARMRAQGGSRTVRRVGMASRYGTDEPHHSRGQIMALRGGI